MQSSLLINEPVVGARMDPVLLPFLSTPCEGQATQHLDELIAQAAPGIARITKSSRTPDDAFQETTYRLIRQLRDLRERNSGGSIGDYLRYVKVIASRVVKGQIRQEHPAHRSLVDAVRHLLKRAPSLASWEYNGQKLCGLAEWQHQPGVFRSDRLTALLSEPRAFSQMAGLRSDAASLGHLELVTKLFEWIGHPVRFDELTRIVCGVKRVKEVVSVSTDGLAGRGAGEWLPDTQRRPDEEAEWKEFLVLLWARILQLPVLHRMAYLLNFTAGDGQLDLFWTYGAASIREIGASLQITEEQFERVWPMLPLPEETKSCIREYSYDEKFALLWPHLPLTDAAIAAMLGTERQKVINLRKAAADRLSRHMIRSSSAMLTAC